MGRNKPAFPRRANNVPFLVYADASIIHNTNKIVTPSVSFVYVGTPRVRNVCIVLVSLLIFLRLNIRYPMYTLSTFSTKLHVKCCCTIHHYTFYVFNVW